MMYQNKFVAAIKVNGQVLRETQNGSVAIPFGAEYSLFLKNLNSVRVKVRVSLDGTDATDGTWLVLAPNTSMDLERFIKAGNFASGNRFKFIERTAEVEAHRGAKGDDGIVRVEYLTERIRPVVNVPDYHYYPVPTPYPVPSWPRPRRWNDYGPRFSSAQRCSLGPSGSRMRAGASVNVNSASASYYSASDFGEATMDSAVVPCSADIGITVAGSISSQQFHVAQDFETTGQSDVIVLHLRGKVGASVVTAPVTVKTKLVCETCGRSSKSDTSFCPGCGTSLQVA